MKKSNLKYLLLSFLALSLLHITSLGQQQFMLNESASKLTISGTSTVHDWEMEVEDFSCEAMISINDNSVAEISNISFTCPVESIKSHNRIMDNKAYKALNSNKYPEISFQFNNSVETKPDGNNTSVAKGTLNINNTKKEVNLVFTTETTNKNQLKVKGEIPLKMSDFNIEPPTAMMGTLKTGDEIKVTYEILLENVHEIN